MVDKICAKIPINVREDTRDWLNQHYFGDIFTALDNDAIERSSFKDDLIRMMSGEQTYDPDNLPCGAKPLNNYAPTSTLNGCTKISQGDSFISRADMFIHHLFKVHFLPKRMRRHIEPRQIQGNNKTATVLGPHIYVGLPVIEHILNRGGLHVKGTPKTTCNFGFDCSWDRGSGMWHLEKGNHYHAKAKPVSDCSNANVTTSLVSADYYAHHLSGSSDTFGVYSDHGESISTARILDAIQDAIMKLVGK